MKRFLITFALVSAALSTVILAEELTYDNKIFTETLDKKHIGSVAAYHEYADYLIFDIFKVGKILTVWNM